MRKLALISLWLILLASVSFAFSIKTGYYVGKGTSFSITGVGFKPDLVIITPDLANFSVFRTSAMSDAQGTAFFAYAADNFADGITSLDNDGFTLGQSGYVNTANCRYTWVAFGGSGGGDFKVGSYIGNSQDNRSITGLGFTPDLVVIKRKGGSAGCWKSFAMSGETTQVFHNANQIANNYIQSLEADGFQIGNDATVNSLNDTYWYFAFKETSGKLKVGTYSGDGNDNRSISGIGFQPNLIWVKGANNTTAQYGVLRTDQSFGDESQYFTNSSNITNAIQSLEADGFQVGNAALVNENGKTFYYVAFGGAPTPPTPTGNYTMAYGSYVGKGSSQTIVSNLSFTPDLVIVKSGTTNYAVFSTSQMATGYSAYFASNAALIPNAITINANGFSVGSDPNVNALGTYYYWIAFGNSGCSNFKVGAYTGNSLDNRSIPDTGFQPDLVVVKGNAATYGCWKSSVMSGDSSAFFHASSNEANWIQALESNGFQVGLTGTNTTANTYFYFAFKETPGYFKIGSYTGNGTTQSISGLGGKPNWVWVKSSTTAQNGVHKGINLGENDYSQYFINLGNTPNLITALGTNSFTVGSSVVTNQSGINYWYAAWLSVPTSLKFTVQPTGVEVGNPITPAPKVAIVDQFGNTVTYDNSTQITLSLSSNPGGATLSGTLTKTVVSGEAIFDDLSLDKSGNGYVLRASATGFPAVDSQPFNVGPGQGNKLAFLTQPTTIPAGAVLPSLQVAVKDALGNIVTGDNTSQITISLLPSTNPHGATLSGTLTRVASAGVATFDDLSINLKGIGYKLLATAPYFQPATSEAFDITAEAIAPTIISYSPSGEGISIESKIVVQFSEAMNQPSVQNAFSMKAIRNNLGNSINFPVSGTFNWISPQVIQFTPASNLEYNYTYQVEISIEAKDLVGNPLDSSLSFTFTTISTSENINTFVGNDGKTRLTIPEGAVGEEFYARISTDPENQPIATDPSKISSADTKVSSEKNKFKYRVSGSAREFVLFSSSGTRITSLRSSATITIPYADANNDGYVDGSNIRIESLRICRLDENNGLWIIYPESLVDSNTKTVSTNVRSLSTFALMALPATTLSNAYAFPNPFKPSAGHTTITFTNLASECIIKIYTLNGDLVKTLNESDGDGQHSWDVKNEAGEPLQSGLYFYIIKSATDTKSGKLVIIR